MNRKLVLSVAEFERMNPAEEIHVKGMAGIETELTKSTHSDTSGCSDNSSHHDKSGCHDNSDSHDHSTRND